ncbi:MAG: AraC family transcriptional regulator [Bacteroidota bacterium]|nr:AraC family transcriptional regulator [Bacteroidota bacterium]
MVKIKSGFKGERAIILPESIINELKSNPFSNKLYMTDIGFYPKAGFHFRKRSKEESLQYILIYCLEGNGWIKTEGETQNISAHQFVIIPKGKAHAYGSDPDNPWTIYWIHFDGEMAGFFAEGLDKPVRISPGSDSRIELRLQLFEEMFATLRNGYSKDNLYYSLTEFYHFLGSLKFLRSYRESASEQETQRDVVDEAIHFMRENIRKRLTLAEIARYVGFSASHLSALFQQKTGYSPLNYLIQLKIQEACHHLDFTDLKINQICMMIGFEDPFYFSRLFTKTMGISPTEYRKKKKG